MNSLDINAILDALPHRYPLLLIDRVIDLDPGKSIVALKNVTINEPFFPGHFPHHPIMPGVLIVEAMAQAAAVLSFRTLNEKANGKYVYYFVGIDNARFKKPVLPGDQLVLKVQIVRAVKGIYKYSARAEVDGQLAAEADIMCTVRPLDKPGSPE